MQNKKGVSIVLSIGLLTAFALTVVMLFFVFQSIIRDEALGQSYFISKDLAATMTVAYAAPESVEIGYEVPVGSDGYPQAGTILIDAENQKVGVSQWTENEMWLRITNGALVAWAFGGVILTSRIANPIVPFPVGAGTNEEFPQRISEKKKAQQQTKRYNDKVAEESSGKESDIFAMLGNQLKESSRKAVARFTAASAISAGLESAEPGCLGACKAASLAGIVFSFSQNFFFVTLPFSSMVRKGHAQSQEMYETIIWRDYSGDNKQLYIDPPNCKTSTKLSKPKVKGLGTSLPFNIPVPIKTNKTQPIKNTETSDAKCKTAQNFFISAGKEDTDFDLGHAAGASALITGIKDFCMPQILTSSLIGSSLSSCAAAYYSAWEKAYLNFPGPVLNFFLGADFLEKDQHYYMEFPYFIQISKEYNSEIGDSQMKVIQLA